MNSRRSRPWKIVAVETHPIQYKAPLFRCIANDPRFDLTVLYAMIPDSSQQGAGFGVPFAWDVPLLDGYRYEVLENRAKNPSVYCFGGCDTPDVHLWLEALRPDVALINGWVAKTCLQTLLACRRLGIPSVVRGEINLLAPRVWWKHLLHDLLLRQYSAYLSVGESCSEFYRFHRISDRRVFPAHCAVDNRRFRDEAGRRSDRRGEIRAAFGLPFDALVFLFAGKLEEKKHPLDLLRALVQLTPTERSKAHVLIAGSGDLMPDCKEFAKANSLPVTFAGFVNQSRLPDAYAAADVLVLPSDAGETWGLVVNEAMASGRPAIVSRAVGCCRDLIVEGETGFSFDLHDIEGLSGLMRRYLTDPELAARQGLRAAEHIRNYSFEQIADGLAAAAAYCTGRRGGGRRC